MGRGHRPNTSELLREFLRSRCSDERLLRIASAEPQRGRDALASAFRNALDTGVFFYSGDGNAYECALLQRHDQTADRPLNELFGAWWLGTFCWEWPVLIDNLGVDTVLLMIVRGCAGLGDEAARAAHAALPFMDFIRTRDEEPVDFVYDQAISALEAIERHGAAGVTTKRYRNFVDGRS